MICNEMLKTAKEMVRIPSVNATSGERDIALYIEEYIRQIPYFQKHPEQVIIQELEDDSLHRRNVFALLRGERENNGKTILFHGHTDTVGLEDYGALSDVACNPEKLEERLKKIKLPKEVQQDLYSGDYFFGRGSCDMKSGDAVFMGVLKELAEDVEKLSGNILVSFNPVEENLHTGIIEGLSVLEEIREKYNLDYILAINNDFICPLYEGDETYTIYTGTVGKLLPCFYIQGKETHVGQCFEGFDASMAAAVLVSKINLNNDFSDGYAGEYSYPPSVLKMKDLKPWYNVQTSQEAFVYFNYFVHNASMQEITEKLKSAARETLEETLKRINEKSKEFAILNRQEAKEYDYPYGVMTYEELLKRAEKTEKFSKDNLRTIMQEEIEKGTDKREIPIAMIRYLLHVADITTPCIVLYYGAPYCPHNTLQGKNEHLIEEIEKLAKKVTIETGKRYRIMKFFPSLSDSSYLKIDDSEESLQVLTANFPGMDSLYPVPTNQIKHLDIPAINYGCYGKDAHKWTERVNISYTFGILPKLIRETVDYYLR